MVDVRLELVFSIVFEFLGSCVSGSMDESLRGRSVQAGHPDRGGSDLILLEERPGARLLRHW